MRRILLITAGLNIGGAEKVTRDIGLYSRKAGIAVDYLVFGDRIGDYERELLETGCRIIHLPSPAESYCRYYRALKRLMRENRYDIVHAHTMFNCGWAMLAAKRCGVTVRIAHAHSALSDGRSVKKSIYEHVMRHLILKHATNLVACGNAAGIRLFGRKNYEKEGKKILNGIDVDRFAYSKEARERIREKLQIQNAFVIGHVGHLMKVKNQAYLIRLLPQVIKRKPNAVLLLLGEGEDRPKLQKLICDEALEDRVILTGNVDNVFDYLSAMDVFAFPSLYEGMPLSIVEVQANGLPCVISTGVPKDVFLTDLLIPLPLDHPDEWVEAVCTAKRSEPDHYASELKRLGLDTESVMRYYLNLYTRVESSD